MTCRRAKKGLAYNVEAGEGSGASEVDVTWQPGVTAVETKVT